MFFIKSAIGGFFIKKRGCFLALIWYHFGNIRFFYIVHSFKIVQKIKEEICERLVEKEVFVGRVGRRRGGNSANKAGKHSTNQHHRKPSSIGGSNDARNISVVNKHDHEAWHQLYGNKSAHKITEINNKTWLDPDFKQLLAPTEIYDDALQVIEEMIQKFNNSNLKKQLISNTAPKFECRICSKTYESNARARKCEKKGIVAPRYKNGDTVLLKINNKKQAMGTIIGWNKKHAYNSHDHEMYTVLLHSGEKMVGVYAASIKGRVSRNRRVKKVNKNRVVSLQKLLRVARKAGFSNRFV